MRQSKKVFEGDHTGINFYGTHHLPDPKSRASEAENFYDSTMYA